MILERIRLWDFRNIQAADLQLGAGNWFLVGSNGQGKTSLLEAVSYVAALRSFRGADTRTLIRQGAKESVLRLDWSRPGMQAGESVALRLRGGAREVTLDEARLERLRDLIGRFPSVVLSSQDLGLVRGSPGDRRRFFDLLLASMEPAYFDALQRYQRSLEGRNQLLKQEEDAERLELLESFEAPLADAAAEICRHRALWIPRLAAVAAEAHSRFSPAPERLQLAWEAREKSSDPAVWRERLSQGRRRDLVLQTTSHGPHRDDLSLAIGESPAAAYASEGQQRSIVLALKLGQHRLAGEHTGRIPLLLADDVLGELDPERRERFWSALPEGTQILATGTVPPPGTAGWRRIDVRSGSFVPQTESKTD